MARLLSLSKVLLAIVAVHLFVLMVLPTVAEAKPKKGKHHKKSGDMPDPDAGGEPPSDPELGGGVDKPVDDPEAVEPSGPPDEGGEGKDPEGNGKDKDKDKDKDKGKDDEKSKSKAPAGFDPELFKKFKKIHDLIEKKIGSTGVSEDEDFDMFREYLEARRVLAEKKYNKDGKKSDKDKDKDVKKVKKGKGKKDKNGKKGEDSDDSDSNSKSDSGSSMDDMDLSLDFDPEIYKQYLDSRNYMDSKKDSKSKIPEGIDYLLFRNYLKMRESKERNGSPTPLGSNWMRGQLMGSRPARGPVMGSRLPVPGWLNMRYKRPFPGANDFMDYGGDYGDFGDNGDDYGDYADYGIDYTPMEDY